MSRDDYITLYKYAQMKLDHLVDILDKQRLYLSDGTSFNDPFEVTVIDNKTNQTTKVRGLHILCLTNSPHKKLMWSYYTNSHKGVCLTVQVPKKLVYPICYTSKRVYEDSDLVAIIAESKFGSEKRISNDFSILSHDKKVAYIKDRKWIEEKEFRIVLDKDDEKPFSDAGILVQEDNKWFIKLKITNVYLGVNFDKNDKETVEKIINACKRNGIQTTQMMLSNSDYSLRPGGKKQYKRDGTQEESINDYK